VFNEKHGCRHGCEDAKVNLSASLTPQEWGVSEVISHPRHSQGAGASPTRNGLLGVKTNTIFLLS